VSGMHGGLAMREVLFLKGGGEGRSRVFFLIFLIFLGFFKCEKGLT